MYGNGPSRTLCCDVPGMVADVSIQKCVHDWLRLITVAISLEESIGKDSNSNRPKTVLNKNNKTCYAHISTLLGVQGTVKNPKTKQNKENRHTKISP